MGPFCVKRWPEYTNEPFEIYGLSKTVGTDVTAYIGSTEFRDFGRAAEEIILYPVTGVRIALSSTGTETQLMHADQLGSVSAITSDSGTLVKQSTYAPFGEAFDDNQRLDPAETKGFISEKYAGLQYLDARYYNPGLTIFIGLDWFEVTEPGVGTNRYSYSHNDPINNLDTGGKNIRWAFGGQLAAHHWREKVPAEVKTGIHTSLDVACMYPGLGFFPDAANTVL